MEMTMHHSAMRSFDETFIYFLSILVESHVTDIICAIALSFITHGDHFPRIRIKFRMSSKRPTLQLSSKSIQSCQLVPCSPSHIDSDVPNVSKVSGSMA